MPDRQDVQSINELESNDPSSQTFLNNIMSNMSKDVEPVSIKSGDDSNPENVNKEKKLEGNNEEERESEEEKNIEEESSGEIKSEEELEKEKEAKPEEGTVNSKEKQNTEINILKQQNAELMQRMIAFQKQFDEQKEMSKKEAEPYYDKLANASVEDIAKVLGNTMGEEFNGLSAKAQAQMLQFITKMTKDMIKDKLMPVENIVRENELAKVMAQKDQQWYKEHPNYNKYKDEIKTFINYAYPNGLDGVDIYNASHIAYKWAEMENVKKSATAENDKRILAGRSLDTATNTAGVERNKAKVKDPLQAAILNTMHQQIR